MKSLRKVRRSLLWSTLKTTGWTRTAMTPLTTSRHQRNPFRPGQRVGFVSALVGKVVRKTQTHGDTDSFCLVSSPGLQLQQSIMKQYYDPTDLHAYFGVVEMPKLERIFNKSKPRFFKRTSSAVWHSPPRMGSLAH